VTKVPKGLLNGFLTQWSFNHQARDKQQNSKPGEYLSLVHHLFAYCMCTYILQEVKWQDLIQEGDCCL
jgi:hypothetical protein